MKVFMFVVVFILTSTLAMAAPIYLACDYDPAADEYIMEINGNLYQSQPPAELRGDATLVMDLENIIMPMVIYTVRLKAINAWGDESGWSSPLEFTMSPDGISITRQQPTIPNILRLISD